VGSNPHRPLHDFNHLAETKACDANLGKHQVSSAFNFAGSQSSEEERIAADHRGRPPHSALACLGRRSTREQWPAFAVREQAVRVPADSLRRAPYLPPHIRNRPIEFAQTNFFERPRRPALLYWREVAIHAGAPRPDIADGVHPRAPAILDAARSRIFCIEPACNPIPWRIKARQKPGSPGEINHTGRRACGLTAPANRRHPIR
jgi:hypothetical protein